MLKQLLGHWKAHRKKPTLLPEETEVHFEDSSTINPLFEDNETADTSEALEELSAVIDAITSDLDKDADDHLEANAEGNLIDIDNEDSCAKNFESPTEKTEKINGKKLIANDESVVSDNKAVTGKNTSAQILVNSEVNEEKEEILRDEFIIDEPKHNISQTINETIPKEDVSPINLVKPEETSEVNESNIVNKEKTTGKGLFKKNKKSPTKQDMILKIQESPVVTSQAKAGKDTGISNSIPTSSKLSEKTENEKVNKPRPIADLIKKFQGPGSDSKSDTQNKSSALKREESISKDDGPINNTKNSNTIVNESEKESISKIFNIPPPPPTEPNKLVSPQNERLKPNESFLASIANGSKNLKSAPKVKTRIDSSLARNKTVSSEVGKSEKITKEDQVSSQVKNETTPSNKQTKPITSVSSPVPKDSLVEETSSNILKEKNESTVNPSKKNKDLSTVEVNDSISRESDKKMMNKSTLPTIGDKIVEDKVIKPKENIKLTNLEESIPSTSQKPPIVTNSNLKQETKKKFPSYRKQTETIAKSSPVPEKKEENESQKKVESAPADSSPVDTKVIKSHSEDSGITRGDQISSETTQDNQQENTTNENTEINQAKTTRKSKRERKIQREHHRNKSCKHCKRQHDGTRPLKRGKCDEYYDILTGARRGYRNKHSESWASDLSWEEKELIRRLRCRRAASRSSSSSMRSKRSRHPNPENGHFHRFQALRRSLSDDSTFYGSSMCSCDECWLSLVKDYAYGRASLRAPTNQAVCTCRTVRPEFLNRKVKFRSETIPEVSTIERSLTTPSIPEESDKKEDSVSDVSNSKVSSSDKDKTSKSSKTNSKSSADPKILKEKYLLMTPWELEEWDLARRKHLLIKRRKRARNMGLIALAMVIFIGLVVTVVMIYLRRKSL